jgi:hypothetical protein
MYDIDLHIIHYKEPQWLFDRCLASLEGQPVNIHIVEGIEEFPPISGRRKGFATGTAKYCSFVDPDDIVEPGAFQKLLDAIGDNDVAYGNERIVIREGSVTLSNTIHHAYLIKRGLEFIDYSLDTVDVIKKSQFLKIVHVNEVLYTWNYYLGTLNRIHHEHS